MLKIFLLFIKVQLEQNLESERVKEFVDKYKLNRYYFYHDSSCNFQLQTIAIKEVEERTIFYWLYSIRFKLEVDASIENNYKKTLLCENFKTVCRTFSDYKFKFRDFQVSDPQEIEAKLTSFTSKNKPIKTSFDNIRVDIDENDKVHFKFQHPNFMIKPKYLLYSNFFSFRYFNAFNFWVLIELQYGILFKDIYRSYEILVSLEKKYEKLHPLTIKDEKIFFESNTLIFSKKETFKESVVLLKVHKSIGVFKVSFIVAESDQSNETNPKEYKLVIKNFSQMSTSAFEFSRHSLVFGFIMLFDAKILIGEHYLDGFINTKDMAYNHISLRTFEQVSEENKFKYFQRNLLELEVQETLFNFKKLPPAVILMNLNQDSRKSICEDLMVLSSDQALKRHKQEKKSLNEKIRIIGSEKAILSNKYKDLLFEKVKEYNNLSDEFKTQMVENQKEINDLTLKVKSLTDKLELSNSKQIESLLTINELQEKMSNLKETYEKLIYENELTITKKEKLEHKTTELEKALEDTKRKQNIEKKELGINVANLKEKIAINFANYEKQINILKQNNKDNVITITKEQLEEIEGFTKQIEDLKKENEKVITQLKAQVNSMESEHRKKVNELLEEKEWLDENLSEMQDQLKNYNDKFITSKKTLNNLLKIEKEKNEVLEQKLNAVVKSYEENIEDKEKKILEIERKNKSILENTEKKDNRVISTYEELLKEKDNKIIENKKVIEYLKKKFNTLEREQFEKDKICKRDLSIEKERYEHLKSESKEFENSIENKTKDVLMINQSLEKMNMGTILKLKEVETENTAKIDELTAIIKSTKMNLDVCKNQIVTLNSDLQEQKTLITELSGKKEEETKKAIEHYKRLFEAKEILVIEAQGNILKLENTLTSLNKEIIALQTNLTQKEAQMNTLETSIKEKNSLFNTQEKTIKQFTIKLDTLTQQKNSCEEDLEDSINTFKNKEADFIKQIELFMQQEKSKDNILTQREEQINTLRTSLDENIKTFTELKDEIQACESSKAINETKAQKEIENIKKELDEIQVLYQNSLKENASLLKTKLELAEEKETEVFNLENLLRQNKGDLLLLTNQIAAIRKENEMILTKAYVCDKSMLEKETFLKETTEKLKGEKEKALLIEESVQRLKEANLLCDTELSDLKLQHKVDINDLKNKLVLNETNYKKMLEEKSFLLGLNKDLKNEKVLIEKQKNEISVSLENKNKNLEEDSKSKTATIDMLQKAKNCLKNEIASITASNSHINTKTLKILVKFLMASLIVLLLAFAPLLTGLFKLKTAYYNLLIKPKILKFKQVANN